MIISIVMSTYNENTNELKECVESILHQTFKDFEFIIVIDNPENIKSIKYLKEVSYQDSRIRIIKNKNNKGLANSLNIAICSAKGEFIARMDADDIALPERLEKQYNFMINNPDIGILATNKYNINENGNIINKNNYKINEKKIPQILRYGSPICHPSIMIRKDLILQLGMYRNFEAAQDYDLWLRAVQSNVNFYILEEKLLKYRIRTNSITSSNPLRQFLYAEYGRKLYYERKKNGLDTFSEKNKNKFLMINGLLDVNQVDSFNKSYFLCQKYIADLKATKKMINFILIFKELCKNRNLRKWFYISIRYKLKVR